MNDSLRTDVFVRFSAETVACACIYLSARFLQVPQCSPITSFPLGKSLKMYSVCEKVGVFHTCCNWQIPPYYVLIRYPYFKLFTITLVQLVLFCCFACIYLIVFACVCLISWSDSSSRWPPMVPVVRGDGGGLAGYLWKDPAPLHPPKHPPVHPSEAGGGKTSGPGCPRQQRDAQHHGICCCYPQHGAHQPLLPCL